MVYARFGSPTDVGAGRHDGRFRCESGRDRAESGHPPSSKAPSFHRGFDQDRSLAHGCHKIAPETPAA